MGKIGLREKEEGSTCDKDWEEEIMVLGRASAVQDEDESGHSEEPIDEETSA